MQYTTVDRIFSKIYRDLDGLERSEADLIEWVGEALDFLKVEGNQEEVVAFMEVKDFHADLPCGFQMALQLAKNVNWTPDNKLETCLNTTPVEDEEGTPIELDCFTGLPVPLSCDGKPLTDYDVAYYRPFYDLKWEYQPFTGSSYYQNNFTPIRLSNNTFFNSLVCREGDESIYNSCTDEYTIVGTAERRFRFSFKEGQVALSYLKTVVDEETGYPMVPDQISYISAIVYYLKWKIAEQHQWSGRQGFAGLATDSERKWMHYVKQAKNWTMMPKSIDDYQDLLEQSHRLIPNHRRYYGYFGKLNKGEDRSFNNPYRNR